jgi:elongation factor G
MKCQKLFQVFADSLEEVAQIETGNIGIVTGMELVKTGETLLLAAEHKQHKSVFTLPYPRALPPIFECAVEPDSTSQEKKLLLALSILHREDPSFHFRVSNETSQVLISGMGELHLEVIVERLRSEWKLPCQMSRIWITYHETLKAGEFIEKDVTIKKMVQGKFHVMSAYLTISPIEDASTFTLKNNIHISNKGIKWTDDERTAIAKGVDYGLKSGPLVRYPLSNLNVKVELSDTAEASQPSETMLTILAADLVSEALQGAHTPVGMMESNQIAKSSKFTLLEPIMKLNLNVPESNFGDILSDLTMKRHGELLDASDEVEDQEVLDESIRLGQEKIDKLHTQLSLILEQHSIETRQNQLPTSDANARRKLITARVPVDALIGYNKAIRSMTSGHGTMTMEVDGYRVLSQERLSRVLMEIRGF